MHRFRWNNSKHYFNTKNLRKFGKLHRNTIYLIEFIIKTYANRRPMGPNNFYFLRNDFLFCRHCRFVKSLLNGCICLKSRKQNAPFGRGWGGGGVRAQQRCRRFTTRRLRTTAERRINRVV